MNVNTGRVASVDLRWRLFLLFITILSIIVFTGVHQQIGWGKIVRLMIETDRIQQDSLKREVIERVFTQEALQKSLESHDSAGEHSFDIAASLLSAVSIFLAIVAILLFREYDRLKEYQDQIDKLIQSYSSQSKADLEEIRVLNATILSDSQKSLTTYIDQVTIKLIDLEKVAVSNQAILDSVPELEDARFEAISYISTILQKKGIIDRDNQDYLNILYYSNLLNPLNNHSHEDALNQINQLLQKIKPSNILGQRLDKKLQILILSKPSQVVSELIFKVQLTLHKHHPY